MEYRVYALDTRGHVSGEAMRFFAEKDKEALAAACEFLNSEIDTVELWRETDYVTTLTRDPGSERLDAIFVVKPDRAAGLGTPILEDLET